MTNLIKNRTNRSYKKKSSSVKTDSYLIFSGRFNIELRKFNTVEKIIKKLNEIDDYYNYYHAKTGVFSLLANQLLKKHKTDSAEKNINSALVLTENLNQEAWKIQFLGLKLQIEVMNSDFEAGKRTLVEAKALIQKIGRNTILPSLYSRYVIGAACYYMGRLEKSNTARNNAEVSKYKKAALEAGKDAVKTGYKFAPSARKPSVLWQQYTG